MSRLNDPEAVDQDDLEIGFGTQMSYPAFSFPARDANVHSTTPRQNPDGDMAQTGEFSLSFPNPERSDGGSTAQTDEPIYSNYEPAITFETPRKDNKNPLYPESGSDSTTRKGKKTSSSGKGTDDFAGSSDDMRNGKNSRSESSGRSSELDSESSDMKARGEYGDYYGSEGASDELSSESSDYSSDSDETETAHIDGRTINKVKALTILWIVMELIHMGFAWGFYFEWDCVPKQNWRRIVTYSWAMLVTNQVVTKRIFQYFCCRNREMESYFYVIRNWRWMDSPFDEDKEFNGWRGLRHFNMCSLWTSWVLVHVFFFAVLIINWSHCDAGGAFGILCLMMTLYQTCFVIWCQVRANMKYAPPEREIED